MATNVIMSARSLEVSREQTAPEFEVKDDGSLVGRLTVSTGGVRWAPSGAREPLHLSWQAFDDVMREAAKKK